MCTIREHTNLFAALRNWIRELSNSIKELSNVTNTSQYGKIVKLDSCPIQLQNSLIELESSQHSRIN